CARGDYDYDEGFAYW
nr:immunoglobulin heavy chain junction region [Mus musculus]NSM05763.1 immunoglobulin heavy chain junction region [Mus musculus]